MAKLQFSDEAKARMTYKLKAYMAQEFDTDLGSFEAEFFLDFIAEQFGGVFYNKGLSDAQEAMMGRIEGINDAIYELEMSE